MKVFGLAIDWVSSPYDRQVWAGVQSFCRDRGIRLLTLVTGRFASQFRQEQLESQLNEFARLETLDGVIFKTSFTESDEDSDLFQKFAAAVSPGPVVSVGFRLPGCRSVTVDNGPGLRSLLDHLYAVHGCRKFAFAGGPQGNRDAEERLGTFLGFLGAHGLEVRDQWILSGGFSNLWGRDAVGRLVVPGGSPGFDALVCASDDIAFGALEALKDRGIQVPRDLVVTGFDDNGLAGPAGLTTVRQPLGVLGREAAEILDSLAGGKSPEDRIYPTEMVIRKSCGCLTPGAPSGTWVPGPPGSLVRAFSDAVVCREPLLFLEILEKAAGGGDQLRPKELQYGLTELRELFFRDAVPAGVGRFAEDLVHAGRTLLSELQDREVVGAETKKQIFMMRLSELHGLLVAAPSVPALGGVIRDFFPLMGIRRFQLTLFRVPGQPEFPGGMVVFPGGTSTGVPQAAGRRTLAADDLFSEGGSFLTTVLFGNSAPLGVLVLEPPEGDDMVLFHFDQLCERLGRGIETVMRIQDLENLVAARTAELKELALRDEMTGLYNRRGFLTLADHEFKAQRRSSHPCTLFFADLDGLKAINDTLGHEAGDEAIRAAGRALTDTFRSGDIVARLGGDEFLVWAPRCGQADALGLRDRLAQALATCPSGKYSISLGWIVHEPGDSSGTLARWMKEADDALYLVKAAKKGRRSLP